jgi:ATP-dependent DNA ligase
VSGGFRWNRGEEGRSVGSLLLGLYGDDGVLHFVGHTSSFSAAEKRALVGKLAEYLAADEGGDGFGAGRTPGEPSRWSQGKDLTWLRLRPALVCEVTFDHLQGPRFRHAATFKRWRTDKAPGACTFAQLEAPVPAELLDVFA